MCVRKIIHTVRAAVYVVCTYMYVHLLDIPRQPTCMKLGTRELYQPIHSWLGSYMSVA